MIRRILAALAVAALLVPVAGCDRLVSIRPAEVDWSDYPASGYDDVDALLAAPDEGEVEPVVRALMRDLRAALEREHDLRPVPVDDEERWFGPENWHPTTGNGYGGEAMTTTINCCTLVADAVPDRRDWPLVVASLDRALAEHGFERFVAEREEPWQWAGTAHTDGQWVWLSIEDAGLDPTGDALREARDSGRSQAQLALSYGATVIADGRRGEFERALEPFRGLERPVPRSD